METTFCELRGKEVINVMDGKRLGRIIDLVFETNCGKILGFVVPCYNKSWNIFKNSNDIFIPYKNVCKIGDDVILVEIFVAQNNNCKKGKCSTPYIATASNFNDSNKYNNTNMQNAIPINPNSTNFTNYNNDNNTLYNTKDINQ